MECLAKVYVGSREDGTIAWKRNPLEVSKHREITSNSGIL